MLGLPSEVIACLFDLDGVLTRTASIHAEAWKATFDRFLRARSGESGEEYVPFTQEDYDAYVDGRVRLDGTRSFLRSRGLELPEGDPSDPPDAPTVHGLSIGKNERVLGLLSAGKVEVYEGSVRYVRACREAGLRTGVVSASANTREVLDSAGIAELFAARVDGKRSEVSRDGSAAQDHGCQSSPLLLPSLTPRGLLQVADRALLCIGRPERASSLA